MQIIREVGPSRLSEFTYFSASYILSLIVTGFAKTVPKGTRSEIQITVLHTLKLHLSTIQTHQVYGCRWPDLLLHVQAASCQPRQPMKVHYRASGASEGH